MLLSIKNNLVRRTIIVLTSPLVYIMFTVLFLVAVLGGILEGVCNACKQVVPCIKNVNKAVLINWKGLNG